MLFFVVCAIELHHKFIQYTGVLFKKSGTNLSGQIVQQGPKTETQLRTDDW